MNVEKLSTTRTTAGSSANSTDAISPSFDVSPVDPDLMGSLLNSIVRDLSGGRQSVDLQQLTQQVQAFLASNGVNVVDTQALNALAAGLASGNLPVETLDSIINLSHGIQGLPSDQQAAALNQMIYQINTQLNTYLSTKGLTGDQIAAVKEVVDAVATLQYQHNQLTRLASIPEVSSTTLTDNNANLMAAPEPVTLAAAGATPNGNQVSVLPYVQIVSQAGTLTAATIVQGNMDVIMQAIIIMFGYINNVQTVTLQNYENNYVTIANNMTVATDMQQGLLEVTQFMSYNVANISSLPGGSINVFFALDLMMNPSGAVIDGAALGICPSGGPIPQVYSQFIQNCPDFMNSLETAYNQYAAFNGAGAESFIQLAAGDGVTPSGSTVPLTGQAQIMTMLTGPVNGAGYSISGLGSQPIFSQAWTNNAGNGNSPLYPDASAYVDASGNPIVTTQPMGSQLSFNLSSVASFIGSGGTGQSSGAGALGVIGTTLTNGSTNSNQVQSLMAAITQSISGIWQLIGQNFIPADKFVG